MLFQEGQGDLDPAPSREGYLEFRASADPRFGLDPQKNKLNFLLFDHLGPRILQGEAPLNTSQLLLTDSTELRVLGGRGGGEDIRSAAAAPDEQDTATSKIKRHSQSSKGSHTLGDHVQIQGKKQSKRWKWFLCFTQDWLWPH